MQAQDAVELRKAWGDQPCEHPRLSREYTLGMHSGDSICTTCGEVLSPEEKNALPPLNNGKQRFSV